MKHADERDKRNVARVLSARIDACSWDESVERVLAWARHRESRYVAICNSHVVVSAARDLSYRKVINGADMATPDGAPVAWMMRRQGFFDQPRISGTELVRALCERCAAEGLPVYFYGSTESTLAAMSRRLQTEFPTLVIAGMDAPPFRLISPEEDDVAVDRINTSYAGIVFVGLGCPKQECWMAEHRGRVNAVMLGVGAAFDFLAGTIQRAPVWMQNAGLEWLHRLASEPRRLWRRYLVTNSLFLVGAARQLLTAAQNLNVDDEADEREQA